jgi:hypothetical protein
MIYQVETLFARDLARPPLKVKFIRRLYTKVNVIIIIVLRCYYNSIFVRRVIITIIYDYFDYCGLF